MTAQKPIGAGKPVFIEHEQNQEGRAVSEARERIHVYLDDLSFGVVAEGDDETTEYVLASTVDEWKRRADIAEQMAEALRDWENKARGGNAFVGSLHVERAKGNAALAAYEQAKGEESA